MYYCEYLPQFFYATIAPIVLFLLTVWMNYRPALTLICFVLLIPISIIMVSKYAKKVFVKYWSKYISMGDSFLDSVNGLIELKIFRADAKRQIKMNESAEEFRNITMKVLIMQLASTTIMDLVAYGGAGIGISVALINYRDGLYEGGAVPSLFAVIFMILVAVEYFLPMRRFGRAFHVGMNGASTGRKILSFLNIDENKWANEKMDTFNIKLKDLSFTYDGTRYVLNNINIEFKKGLNSIVGESGCYKSTLLKLLLRFYESNGIKYNDIGIDDINTKSLYKNVTMYSQMTYLFDDTILYNLKIAKEDATMSEVVDACQKSPIHDFITSLPDGYNTKVGSILNNLSAGEKQCLGLARCFFERIRTNIT